MEAQTKYDLAKSQAITALVTASQSLFFDVDKFEHAQRVARMLSTSTLVPEHFRNNLGNCVIALNYAERINADPFMVMQNMYVVHGRPGIEGKLVIALVNQCGRFEPIEFEESAHSCIAYAKEIKSGKTLKGPTVTIDMVKAEGWLNKTGSKWLTMPQVMFRYRSAVFFARTYCPEVLLGMRTVDELEEMIDLKQDKKGVYVPDPKLLADELKEKVEEKLDALKEEGQISPDEQPAPESDKFPCPHCKFVAVSDRGLKRHITISHKPETTPEPGKEQDEPSSSDPFINEANTYKSELESRAWENIMKLYGMVGKDLSTLELGYREAFLARCKAQLDIQNKA